MLSIKPTDVSKDVLHLLVLGKSDEIGNFYEKILA